MGRLLKFILVALFISGVSNSRAQTAKFDSLLYINFNIPNSFVDLVRTKEEGLRCERHSHVMDKAYVTKLDSLFTLIDLKNFGDEATTNGIASNYLQVYIAGMKKVFVDNKCAPILPVCEVYKLLDAYDTIECKWVDNGKKLALKKKEFKKYGCGAYFMRCIDTSVIGDSIMLRKTEIKNLKRRDYKILVDGNENWRVSSFMFVYVRRGSRLKIYKARSSMMNGKMVRRLKKAKPYNKVYITDIHVKDSVSGNEAVLDGKLYVVQE